MTGDMGTVLLSHNYVTEEPSPCHLRHIAKNERTTNMLYIATALYIEAKPVIEYFKLKRNNEDHYFQVFHNDIIALIITGVGKVNSAIGVSHILSQHTLKEEDCIVNIGICGAGTEDAGIGRAYLINKITDHETGRDFYPDVLVRHPFEEADIETYASPVTTESNLSAKLCDMESSGFYQAASKFFSPHQIYMIKIVSDRLEGERLKEDFILELIHNNLEAIDKFLAVIAESFQKEEILQADERRMIAGVIQGLRLTEAQKNQLVKACENYKIRKDKTNSVNVLDFLKEYENLRVKTKDEGKKLFRQIVGKLSE
jgi:nucleoside phosphorylase